MDASNEDLVRAVDAEKRAELAEMIKVITEGERSGGNSGWLIGIDTLAVAAGEWCLHMDAPTASAWIALGAFDPDRVADLIAAGYTVDDFLTDDSSVPSIVIGVPGPWNGQRTLLDPATEYSLVYAWCNRDVSLDTVRALVDGAR